MIDGLTAITEFLLLHVISMIPHVVELYCQMKRATWVELLLIIDEHQPLVVRKQGDYNFVPTFSVYDDLLL